MLKEKRKESDAELLKCDFPAAHPNISETALATQICLVFQLPSFFFDLV